MYQTFLIDIIQLKDQTFTNGKRLSLLTQEMKGAYVLDDNDYIIYMTNYIVYNMEVLDQPMTCITLMETEVQNPGEPVVVTLPSTDGYEDLIGLYDGVIESEVE